MASVPPRILGPASELISGPSFVPLPKAPAPGPAPKSGGPVVISQVTDPLLTRTAYFDGRLLTADDLIRDQQYLDQRLLEMGRVLGDGVVEGLQLTLDETNHLLRVKAGVAITPLGRALVVDGDFAVSLGDRATISRLNRNRSAHFPSGLYAVVLCYAEREEGLAEAYPTDLASRRRLRADGISEGVELVLAPLALPVPQGGEAAARARLAMHVIGHEAALARLPEDGVALGVLAMRDDAPRWVDAELLRHPRRLPFAPGASVADLSRHYEAVFRRARSERAAGGLSAAFAAADYFHRLPPAGTAPPSSFDPEAGTQSFFPDGIDVWVAPVRSDDLAHVRREALDLDWIDLDAGEPAEVLVLARLQPEAYAAFARRLEAPGEIGPRLLPRFDGLRLRVVGLPPIHRLDTDAAVWKQLWSGLGEDDVTFVRRQPRAAETGVSGIVLARGYVPPLPQVPSIKLPPGGINFPLQPPTPASTDSTKTDTSATEKPGGSTTPASETKPAESTKPVASPTGTIEPTKPTETKPEPTKTPEKKPGDSKSEKTEPGKSTDPKPDTKPEKPFVPSTPIDIVTEKPVPPKPSDTQPEKPFVPAIPVDVKPDKTTILTPGTKEPGVTETVKSPGATDTAKTPSVTEAVKGVTEATKTPGVSETVKSPGVTETVKGATESAKTPGIAESVKSPAVTETVKGVTESAKTPGVTESTKVPATPAATSKTDSPKISPATTASDTSKTATTPGIAASTKSPAGSTIFKSPVSGIASGLAATGFSSLSASSATPAANLAQLKLQAGQRAPDAASKKAAAEVLKLVEAQPDTGKAVLAILGGVSAAGDSAVWQTLLSAMKLKKLGTLLTSVTAKPGDRTPAEMLAISKTLKLDAAAVAAWDALA